jgi:hypothetical protein
LKVFFKGFQSTRLLNDRVSGTLVNACAAVDTCRCINHRDIIALYGVLRADIDARAASDTIIRFYRYHEKLPLPDELPKIIF